MGTIELLNKIQTELKAATWPASANKVFQANSVPISMGPDDEIAATLVMPVVVIRPLDMVVDPDFNEEPDLLRQSVGIRLFVSHPGDHHGQKALQGGNIPDVTKSEGKGIFDIEKEILNAIQVLNTLESLDIQSRSASATLPVQLGERTAIFRDYIFDAWVPAD